MVAKKLLFCAILIYFGRDYCVFRDWNICQSLRPNCIFIDKKE